jgi:lysophospholipase L1-like esterase
MVSKVIGASGYRLQPSDKYVALGSSFAAGPGVPPVDPTAFGACGRSLANYAHLLAAQLQLSLTDVTCNGATIADIVSTRQFGFLEPQVNAVTADTKLVTVTVGGNDVGYLSGLYSQSGENDPATLSAVPGMTAEIQEFICAPIDHAAVDAALASLQAQMTSMVQALRAKAPDATIVLVDYLSILPLTGTTPCLGVPITADQAQHSNRVAQGVNLATRNAADSERVGYLPASVLSTGHTACSEDPWVFAWEFGSDFLAGGQAAYHPNANGMSAIAAALCGALRGESD